MTKRKAIVVDIDGVILDSSVIYKEMLKLGLKGDEKWSYFHKHCSGPKVVPIKEMILFLNSINPSISIVLSTARNECCREETEERLYKENFHYTVLYMRGKDDERPSDELKRDHLKGIAEEFDVIAFIDDDLSNCLMAEKEGVLALRKVD